MGRSPTTLSLNDTFAKAIRSVLGGELSPPSGGFSGGVGAACWAEKTISSMREEGNHDGREGSTVEKGTSLGNFLELSWSY